MKRVFVSVVLAAVMLLSLLCMPVWAAGPLDPDIAIIDVVNNSLNTSLRPGGSATVTISMHFIDSFNYTTYNSAADDDKVQVRVSDASITGLYISNADLLYRTIDKIDAAGWAQIQYQVRLDSSFTGAAITIKVEFMYSTETHEKSFTFPVGSRPPDPAPDPDPLPAPDPTVAAISVAPRSVTLHAGRSNNISVEVVNSGEKAANNLSATLTPVGQEFQRVLNANPPSAFTATLNTVRRAGSSNSGNRGTFSYNITAPDNLKSGVYEFRVGGSFYHETSNNLGVFEGSIQVVVINDFEPASMQIVEAGPLYPVRPGELINVNIQVQNTGGLTAGNAAVSLKNASETAFTMVGSTASGMIGQVGAGQTGNRTLTLRAASAIQPGTYPLVFELRYLDSDDQPQTTEYEASVEVLAVPSAQIEMVRAVVPGGTLVPGQRAVMTVELRNPSATEATDVRVRVSGFSGTGLYLADGENNLPTKIIDSIPGGGRASVTYNVILSGTYDMGSIALQAEISHALPDGSLSSAAENISFAVILPTKEDPSETPGSTPKLIIDHYTMSWEDEPIQNLKAGGMFDLAFTLRNTSALTELRNITVTLSSVDGIFMPAAGSNTFYIESVEMGGEVELTVRLVVSQSAETKSYQLNFALDYEDEKGASFRPAESLSLPVVVPLVVELANFNPPMWGEMGMQTYMMFQYINKGKSIVYNFSIEIEGEFMVPDGALMYIGNLSPGYNDYFECMMIPMMPGELSGAVVMRFEDATGNETEMREEFVMTVNEPFYPEFPGGDFPDGFDPWNPFPEENGGGGWFGLPWWVIIAGGVCIVVIAAVVIILVRKSKIKKRRLLEEDDDYSEDES